MGPLVLVGLLFAFFLGLDLMGLAFKLFGKGFAETLIERTANPFVGLLVGILATTLVQSSSTTTSMTVGLVAAGALTIDGAIPIIMGANIGTSVTNTLVSLAHVSRREEFRRAFAGATLHDFFNLLTVIVLFPLELRFHILRGSASALEKVLEGSGGIELFDPLKAVIRPVAQWVSGSLLGSSGALTLAAGVLLLFFALKLLVDLLKSLVSSKAEQILDRTLFRSALAAIGAGALITVMVQSSSITTSVMVPLVGAGVVTLEQLFPFTIGANLGTTVTALLAALATGNPAAVSVALAHLLFNALGTLLIYPVPWVRALPLAMARALGALGGRNRPAAIAYVLAVFYGLPILLLFLSGTFRVGPKVPAAPPPAVEVPAPREQATSGAGLTLLEETVQLPRALLHLERVGASLSPTTSLRDAVPEGGRGIEGVGGDSMESTFRNRQPDWRRRGSSPWAGEQSVFRPGDGSPAQDSRAVPRYSSEENREAPHV